MGCRFSDHAARLFDEVLPLVLHFSNMGLRRKQKKDTSV